MSEYSFLVPFVPPRPEQLLRYAALAQWSGVPRLWQGQALVNEVHQDFTYAAASGFRVPIGIGVSLMPFRHPLQAAVQAQALAVATGHSVTAGYGPGAKSLQKSMLGAPYRSQLGAVREYLTIMRALLETGKADHLGEFFTCQAELGAVPRPMVQLGLGVLRPGMARLAGEIADAAITWLTPASYLRDEVVPAIRAGAEAAGRAMPRVVAMVPVAIAAPGRDATGLALSSNAGHMRLPHYVDMLRRAGIRVDPANPEASARALVEGGAFMYGGLSELAEQLKDYSEAGVDEIVFNVTGVLMHEGEKAAMLEIEALLEGLSS